MSAPQITPEVLTLEEAAEYLRLTSEVVRRQAVAGRIPARLVEGEWRFLRAALADWLRSGDAPKNSLLSQAGCFKDDETLAEIVAEAYRRRGRPKDDPARVDPAGKLARTRSRRPAAGGAPGGPAAPAAGS